MLLVVHDGLLGAVELVLKGVLGSVLVARKQGRELHVADLAGFYDAVGVVAGHDGEKGQRCQDVLEIRGDGEAGHCA